MREIAVFSGGAHRELAVAICAHLGLPLQPALIERFSNDCLEVQLQANCRERDVFIVQPLCPPVQEHLMELLQRLRERRVGWIAVACTHGLFTGPAIARLRAQEDVSEVVTTDTVPIAPERRIPRMTVLSVAPLLAEAIRRIHEGESVSALFADGP
jgi:ribose-phosphate pyrophosphokinase